MRINGFSGTNAQAGAMGMAQTNDSVSRNIQNQIANARQKLQDLSSNEEMSLEDKMKKRQEIQQEITNLNQQLRQHQIEQRKEQQSKNSSSMDDMVAGTNNASAKKSTGLSQASMQAMISADSSMKQAKIQGSMATQMKGRAGVLESEIKQDAGKGNTEKKEEELADLQTKAQSATVAQMSTLADVNKSIGEAAKEDSRIENTEAKNDKTEKTQETIGAAPENTDVKAEPETVTTVEISVSKTGQNAAQQAVYTPIDVRL
ncbi:MAG: FlxA-like family protein [Acetivibrio ethanolgignens]